MKKRRFHIPFRYLLPVVVLVCALIGGAVAKYVTTEKVEGKVTFTATLADSVVVQEHTATQNANGSYTLNSGNENIDTDNKITYNLIPGLDIPKDPHVVITGKTSIPAYLFIEMVDTTNAALTFSLTDNWKAVDGATPKTTGGKVYVYTTDKTNAAPITATPTAPIYILKDNQVIVSQTIPHNQSVGTLSFSAKLVEAQGDNLAELYNGA